VLPERADPLGAKALGTGIIGGREPLPEVGDLGRAHRWPAWACVHLPPEVGGQGVDAEKAREPVLLELGEEFLEEGIVDLRRVERGLDGLHGQVVA
jgi:hypothetical protein